MPVIRFNVYGQYDENGEKISLSGHSNVTFLDDSLNVIATIGANQEEALWNLFGEFGVPGGQIKYEASVEPWGEFDVARPGVTASVPVEQELFDDILAFAEAMVGTIYDYDLIDNSCHHFAQDILNMIHPNQRLGELFDKEDIEQTGLAPIWFGIEYGPLIEFLDDNTYGPIEQVQDTYNIAVAIYGSTAVQTFFDGIETRYYKIQHGVAEAANSAYEGIIQAADLATDAGFAVYENLSIIADDVLNLFGNSNRVLHASNLQLSISWISVVALGEPDDLTYAVQFGGENDALISTPGQFTLILDSNVDFSGSQSDDFVLVLEHGSNVFGASGSDSVSFALMSSGIQADLPIGEIKDISGTGPITELSSIENLTGTNYADDIEGRDNANTLIGLDGDDTIQGRDGDDRLEGGSGNDSLYGGNDDDRLYGGEGHDSLYGNNHDDTIYGGDGDDLIYGGRDDDRLFGQDDEDTLYGLSGDDYLIGGDHADYLDGGSGNDDLSGGSHDDTLLGGLGNDDLSGGSGDDHLDGGEDDDELSGQSGHDYLTGRDGDDDLDGGSGNDTLYGGDGNDTLAGSSGTDSLYGGSGNDILILGSTSDHASDSSGYDILDLSGLSVAAVFGYTASHSTSRHFINADGSTSGSISSDFEEYILTDFDDALYGFNSSETYHLGGGNDSVTTRDGDDTVFGGSGDDYINTNDDEDLIYGGSGNDDIDAGNGDDTIYGGVGDDTIDGDDGDDYIYSGFGDNRIYGRSGFDTVDYSEAHASVRADGSGAFNYYHTDSEGWVFNDDDFRFNDIEAIMGSDFDDDITLTHSLVLVGGGEGSDTITATVNDATIYGEEGNDTVIGGAGDDRLFGGSGDDIISSGGGNDTLWGNSGADTFVFNSMAGTATIADFELGQDRLDFSTLFANAESVSLRLGDTFMLRMNCFVDLPYDSLSVSFADGVDGLEVHLNTGSRGSLNLDQPIAVLVGIELADLSFSDLMF